MWALDILHVVDLHGVASHARANLLVDIIRDGELPRCHVHAQSLEFLNAHLQDYYTRVEATDRVGEFSVARCLCKAVVQI